MISTSKPKDVYLTIPLTRSQKADLAALAHRYGLKVQVFARILLYAGQRAYYFDPGECFRTYANSIEPRPAFDQRPKTRKHRQAQADTPGTDTDIDTDADADTPIQAATAKTGTGPTSRQVADMIDAQPSPDNISGTIYDIRCPWCGHVIDTLCEQSLKSGDVVNCDHCDNPFEITALGDAGEVSIRRYNAPE